MLYKGAAHPRYGLDENGLRGGEVQPHMPGSAGSEDMAGTQRDTGVVEKPPGRPGQIRHHRKTVGDFFLEAELSTIEPRQVGALRPLIFHCGKVLGDQIAQ